MPSFQHTSSKCKANESDTETERERKEKRKKKKSRKGRRATPDIIDLKNDTQTLAKTSQVVTQPQPQLITTSNPQTWTVPGIPPPPMKELENNATQLKEKNLEVLHDATVGIFFRKI